MSNALLRLLIDSCLTPTAIPRLLKTFGDRVDPVHLDQVLPLESTDDDVVAWAVAEHRLVITANGADFLALLRHRPEHPGLGLVIEQNTRDRQIRAVQGLVGALVRRLESGGAVSGRVFVWTRANRLVVRRGARPHAVRR